MNRIKMPGFKLVFLAAVSSFALLLNGCNAPNNSQNSGVKEKDSTYNAGKVQDPLQAGITLPILDALFFEDGFEQDLKSKLQLSSEQLTRLKQAARTSVAELNEDGTGDHAGSARDAAKRSEEQINSILGTDKAGLLYKLIQQRYASGDIDGLAPTQPNFVPTDTRVVVNAPAYRMDVYQDGKLVKTYKVGIGYPEFPLPTGMRRAENIIFNPTWTPPDEPWVKGKVEAGKKVAAGSKLNPLGPIKIPIGSPSLIHGGKLVAKLGTFASHGCVGMTNEQVQDFAGVLSGLGGSPMSADSILGFRNDKKDTKTARLNKAVPVDLRYETIVAESGMLHIYRDVYERGTNTVENAGNVLAVYGVKYDDLSPAEKTALDQALTAMSSAPRENPAHATNDTTTGGGEEHNSGATTNKERAKKGKVTRSIIGQKEVVVAIAALKGKGYPAAVNLDDGKQAAGSK